MNQKLEEIIEEMRDIGDMLIPYNWPQNHPRFEVELNPLKIRHIEIDGYSLVVHFNRADYNDNMLESLQIFSERSPFVPFALVFELGKRFLGGHHLYLIEIYKENRKIYCWTMTTDKTGRPIPSVQKDLAEYCEYDGQGYYYLPTSAMNFH